MSCHEMQSWSFSGLVCAFLDLAIAYLLLCASTLAYLASKFLGVFGLSLPCPCNGLFGDPNSDNCWQSVLVNSPSEKISSIQFSVKSKFPFDSIWDENLNPEMNVNPMKAKNCENGCFPLDDETSCSSFQKRRREMGFGSGVMYAEDVKEERFDIKGKGVSNQKVRHALRRRRKGSSHNGRSSSVSSYDPFQSDAHPLCQSPASVSKMVNESNEGSMVPDCNALHYGRVYSVDVGVLARESPDFGSNELVNENKLTDKGASPADNLKFNAQGEVFFDGSDKNAIRVLEQAVEEEHAAHAALYLELEKERNAAATAADEAMAMILRLQEEKASIEMEARQYQRMIEEKSAYDFEEMSILKEILIRREREKHFLEKEVETYRQMIFGSDQLDSDAQYIGTSHGKRASSLLYPCDDPEMMLQRINESVCGKEKAGNASKISGHDRSIELQDCTLTFGKKLPIPELDEVESLKQECIPRHSTKYHQHLSSGNKGIDEEFGEMEPLSLEKSPLPQEGELQRLEMHSQFNSSTAEGYNLHDKKMVAPVREVQRQSDVTTTSQGLASKTIQTYDETRNIFPSNFDRSEIQDKDLCNAMFNKDPCVHDVQEIVDKFNMSSEVRGNGCEKLSVNAALDIPRSSDSPSMSRSRTEQDVSRSCSDITSGLPSMVYSLRKPLLSDLRRNSMSAVDYERYKIDSEVGRLRERLRIVQEGRGKLNVSMEHKEKEKTQLQLLENIVSQLREIRQLTEPRKAVRQVSLPPPSCKVMSKKRRWRSVSLEVRSST